MRIKDNLGGLIVSSTKASPNTQTSNIQIGRVFGVITTENTPTQELFERFGGWAGVGTIFYLDYKASIGVKPENVDLSSCKTALPLNASVQDYPLVGELVLIQSAPAPSSQVDNTASQNYYLSVVNIWNNIQQNSPTPFPLGKSFTENPKIQRLISYEGDRIILGRKGQGIRFGSTSKGYSNEWSEVGENGDPITIITNGYDSSDKPYSEQINKDLSSIYLSSTQRIPLQTDKTGVLNPITKPIEPNKYSGSQLILNSGRIVLNANKNDLMLFSTNNIELITKKTISFNSDDKVIFNSKNYLGLVNEKLPTEPMLLGNQTTELLSDILQELSNLAGSLSAAVTPPPGSPLVDVNAAGVRLAEALNDIIPKLNKIKSNNNFLS